MATFHAAAGSGIGLSASPSRLVLRGRSAASITVRNPGARPLVVEVSRAEFERLVSGLAMVIGWEGSDGSVG